MTEAYAIYLILYSKMLDQARYILDFLHSSLSFISLHQEGLDRTSRIVTLDKGETNGRILAEKKITPWHANELNCFSHEITILCINVITGRRQ